MSATGRGTSSRLAVLDGLDPKLIESLSLGGLPTESAPAGPLYHLADGIILSIGPNTSRLIDLASEDERKIDFRFIAPLERLVLGWDLAELPGVVPALLEAGVIAQGAPGADRYVRERLAKLDDLFVASYAEPLSERHEAARDKLLSAHAGRKRFFEQVGQCPVLPETALRRALSVGDAQDVGQLEVLCLGDDDLVSVALAALGHKVTVFDIDDFLLGFVRGAARDMKLDIEAREVDLRDPLDAALRERFDVVVTDPMANRECFELFLSRALSMLKPGGRLFSAVFSATSELFADVCEEMKLERLRWSARHNRYYTHYLKLHWYESDWVETRKTAATTPAVPPDDFRVPLNLYREDFNQRLPTFVNHFEGLEELRYAMPLFLDMLFDIVELEAGLKIKERTVHPGEGWSLVHCVTEAGHITLHVDRLQRRLTMEMFPFEPPIADVLRTLIMNAYKRSAREAALTTTGALWELRVR